ncbi:MAG: DUF4339 domain-containing protein [Gemmataceae bacterium]
MASMWYYSSKNEQKGPVTYDELAGLAQSGRVRSTDLVWEEGSPDWIKASTVRGLFDAGPSAQVRADEPAPRRRAGRDDDFADDRPRRSVRRPQKSSNGLMIGLIAGGAGLLIVAIVVIIIVVANSNSRPERPPGIAFKPEPIPVMPGPGGGGPVGIGLPAGGKLIVPSRIGTRADDTITNFDSFDFGPGRGGCRCKVYQTTLVPGKLYTIDMMSGVMDCYLRLVDSRGMQVAADDDGGDGLNARIVFRPAAADTYRIVCTTFMPGEIGNFTLSIRED